MAVIDDEKFTELIKEYTPNMYRLAFGILHNYADAEDAVAETILKSYAKLRTLRRAESFRAWLMQITANEAKKVLYKSKRTTPVDDIEEYMPAFHDEHHELWDAVMKLDIVYSEVIVLFFYERLSVKEIGKILRISEGTVKSRLYRGKKQLKSMLQDGLSGKESGK